MLPARLDFPQEVWNLGSFLHKVVWVTDRNGVSSNQSRQVRGRSQSKVRGRSQSKFRGEGEESDENEEEVTSATPALA